MPVNRFWERTRPGTPLVSPPLTVNVNAQALDQMLDDGLVLMRLLPFTVLSDLAIVYLQEFDSAGWIDLELHNPDADPPQTTTLHRLTFGEPEGTPPGRALSTDPIDSYFLNEPRVVYASRRERELRARLTLGDGAELPAEGWMDVFVTFLPLNRWAL